MLSALMHTSVVLANVLVAALWISALLGIASAVALSLTPSLPPRLRSAASPAARPGPSPLQGLSFSR